MLIPDSARRAYDVVDIANLAARTFFQLFTNNPVSYFTVHMYVSGLIGSRFCPMHQLSHLQGFPCRTFQLNIVLNPCMRWRLPGKAQERISTQECGKPALQQ
jgi:hypothetical protein